MTTPSHTLFALLAPLVAQRVYPVVFPLQPLPQWPAIRYTPLGGAVWPTNCGAGDASTDDFAVQIDTVAPTYDEAQALALQVRSTLDAATPPWVADAALRIVHDHETNTFMAQQDYTHYPSSGA